MLVYSINNVISYRLKQQLQQQRKKIPNERMKIFYKRWIFVFSNLCNTQNMKLILPVSQLPYLCLTSFDNSIFCFSLSLLFHSYWLFMEHPSTATTIKRFSAFLFFSFVALLFILLSIHVYLRYFFFSSFSETLWLNKILCPIVIVSWWRSFNFHLLLILLFSTERKTQNAIETVLESGI